MGDILYYRIPNGEKKRLNGRFKEIKDISNAEGFVISSFDQSKLYLFVKDGGMGETHYSTLDLHCISKEDYFKNARWFLSELIKRNLAKAVFSRIKAVPFDRSPDSFFDALCNEYPNAFVYFISSPKFGTWLGATPEVLLSVHGTNAKTMALAGTLSSDPGSSWGGKEKKEQYYVAEFIRSKLIESGIRSVKEWPRENLIAGPVTHLKTEFTFDMEGTSAGHIAQALHPTPAVCGLPQDKSLELIIQAEEHERLLYSGFIGVIEEGDSSLYVNLRCARITSDKAYLFLGGGFTKDSDVEREWQETENKARTLLNVIENL